MNVIFEHTVAREGGEFNTMNCNIKICRTMVISPSALLYPETLRSCFFTKIQRISGWRISKFPDMVELLDAIFYLSIQKSHLSKSLFFY